MVKFVEKELEEIKKEVISMWTVVSRQMLNAEAAIEGMDEEIAKQIIGHEKLVNSYDLKIDSMVEDFIALYTPVAIDLRFVLAMLNINNNLERIGDYAEGLARFVIRSKGAPIDAKLMADLRLSEMFSRVRTMMDTARRSLDEENINLAKSVMEQDNALDEINADSIRILSDYATAHPDQMRLCLELTGVFRKLERTGDHLNNIMELVIFYLDAHVVKHHDKTAE